MRDRCCGSGSNTSLPWHHGAVPASWAQFVLWCLTGRRLCLSSPHLSRRDCCEAPGGGGALSSFCWDGAFSRASCCGPPAARLPSARGDPSCWSGSFTFEECCEGGGDAACWDDAGHYSFERCCGAPAAAPPTPLGSAAVLEEILYEGGCLTAADVPGCAARWREAVTEAGALAHRRVQQAAVHLAREWKRGALWLAAVGAAPAFAVCIALTAALALVDQWAGQPSPPGIWEDVAGFVAVYREHIAAVATEELSGFHIRALDETLLQRVHLHYQASLQATLEERITNVDQEDRHFGERLNASFLSALQELVEVVRSLGIDFVPIQGTLISLLRYGSFPAGRLSNGKWDVVDNDAEIMLLLDNMEDLDTIGPGISLALEARGWPPCTQPHFRKYVCFSMRHDIPCKIEMYAATKDLSHHVIYFTRTCTGPGECQYSRGFPLQHWQGQMPMDVIYPLGRCRMGSSLQGVFCPNMPLELLIGWNQGEYRNQSVVVPLDGRSRRQPAGAPANAAKVCLALPVLSRDRDKNDVRNKRLQNDGLSLEDLRLLHGYARTLQRQGFASLHAHLKAMPCLWRQERISMGDPHAGLSRLGAA